ncbi:MAG: hypothetical protein HS113_29780 [Verrucomicrobiales bacterium]|nr:hypothetical protein [Verrucomicrobiales bacterium]
MIRTYPWPSELARRYRRAFWRPREVGRAKPPGSIWYGRTTAAGQFQGCTAYADFRELLAQRGTRCRQDYDPGPPPCHHRRRGHEAGPARPRAQTHRQSFAEYRLVLETARTTGLATHLLAYGSGSENARIVEHILQDAIGPLREIHNWSNRPVWPQYHEIPRDQPPVPPGFDWDLWLGPATFRPYHPHYTHTVFRGWYDFGGGSMADMGIYSLWPVFTGLGLEAPLSAEAWATHACTIENNVSRPIPNDFSYPDACTLRFRFAASAARPALDLFGIDACSRRRN